MSVASADVQWQLIRNNHSFLVKLDGHIFSSEPFNLTNQHSYKFSGLVNPKLVGVVAKKSGAKKSIQLITKSNKAAAVRQPRSIVSVGLNKHVRNHKVRAASTIQTLTSGSHYRADLTRFAVARYHALQRATKAKPALPVQKKRRGAAAKKA
jgi:large subunit ribosomal protein L28e